MPGDTPYSPEEIEELKRLFKENAPPDGVITYKGRRVRLKPPEVVTVKEVSITSNPYIVKETPSLKKLRALAPDLTAPMKSMREDAARKALRKSFPPPEDGPLAPIDPKLLLHVKGLEEDEKN